MVGQSSGGSEQWEQHFAQGSAAVHWCCITAHLYDQQIFIGVIALTQGCCQAVSQSSTEQWGQHFAQGSAALHWWWVTAVVGQSSGNSILPEAVLQCIGVGSLHTCMITKPS